MSTQAKELHRRYFEELFSEGRLEVADEIVAVDYCNHNPAVPYEQPGVAWLKQWVAELRRTFPDIHFTIDDQIAEGDKVVTRLTITGTHQAEFMGIPATGKSVKATAINIHRIAEGKIQEGWFNWDALGFMQQLGGVPAAKLATT